MVLTNPALLRGLSWTARMTVTLTVLTLRGFRAESWSLSFRLGSSTVVIAGVDSTAGILSQSRSPPSISQELRLAFWKNNELRKHWICF